MQLCTLIGRAFYLKSQSSTKAFICICIKVCVLLWKIDIWKFEFYSILLYPISVIVICFRATVHARLSFEVIKKNKKIYDYVNKVAWYLILVPCCRCRCCCCVLSSYFIISISIYVCNSNLVYNIWIERSICFTLLLLMSTLLFVCFLFCTFFLLLLIYLWILQTDIYK